MREFQTVPRQYTNALLFQFENRNGPNTYNAFVKEVYECIDQETQYTHTLHMYEYKISKKRYTCMSMFSTASGIQLVLATVDGFKKLIS